MDIHLYDKRKCIITIRNLTEEQYKNLLEQYKNLLEEYKKDSISISLNPNVDGGDL